MKIWILGALEDQQTGLYILDACIKITKDVVFTDVRRMMNELPTSEIQATVINEMNDLKLEPDLIIVMQGKELAMSTLVKIKEKFPKSTLVNWFFDKLLGSGLIYETEHVDMLKTYDWFFCSMKGVADKLNKLGVNAYYLDEGCDPTYHYVEYFNNFQRNKYGEDVAFIGNLGYFDIHPDRIKTLQRVIKEGFNLKIWGDIIGDMKHIPADVKAYHTGMSVVNRAHSIVSKASSINLGLDHGTDLELGHSARLFRIMCAGGLYLSDNIPGFDKLFKTNKEDDVITKDLDLVIFYDEDDMIRKIDFLLEHDDIRESIAVNGRNKVTKYHTFDHRMREMIDVTKK